MPKLTKEPRDPCKFLECTKGPGGKRHPMDGYPGQTRYCCEPHRKAAARTRKLARQEVTRKKRVQIFKKFHKNNPEIWLGVRALSLAQMAAGAEYIFVRHNMRAVAVQLKMGISDGFSYFYSRMLTEKYPELKPHIKQVK